MAPFRFVFLLFISSFFILGLYDYLVNYEENGCEMTYMYERPQYLVSFAKSHFYAPPTIIHSSSEYRSFIDMGRPVNRVNVPGYDVVWIQWCHGWVYVILSAGIKISLRLSDFSSVLCAPDTEITLGFYRTEDGFIIRSRTRQNFELVHIIGPVQNFGRPARNFGPLRAEFAWWEWRKTLGGHVANWVGLSGFSPRANKISHTFFIDCINKYSKVSNAHNSDDCHGVFNGGMLNKGRSFPQSRFDCLGLMYFFHG